jgi:hypothetical protein
MSKDDNGKPLIDDSSFLACLGTRQNQEKSKHKDASPPPPPAIIGERKKE